MGTLKYRPVRLALDVGVPTADAGSGQVVGPTTPAKCPNRDR